MKKISELFSSRNIKVIGYIIFIVSIGFLIREIFQYNRLPSKNDPMSQVVDYFKYKQNTLTQGYIWILLALFGWGLIKRNNLGWLIPQIFSFMGFVPFTLMIYYYGFSLERVIYGTLYLLFLISIIILFNRPKLKDYFKISFTRMKSYYLIIPIIAILYFILERYDFIIIK